jgi:hypothetical protein
MQAKFKKSRLIMRISKARLASYGDLDKDPMEKILADYLWNCALSESLYQSLHWFEIALRNNIHMAASTQWGSSWLTSNKLLYAEQKLVNDCAARLISEQKNQTPEDIVASLNFGFWSSIFRKDYEQKIRPLLPKIFPYSTPSSERTRRNISDRLNTIRKFRNRIFHFESILKYKPEVRYGEIKQTIQWMAPELIPFLELNCNFSTEYSRGPSFYINEARNILSSMED